MASLVYRSPSRFVVGIALDQDKGESAVCALEAYWRQENVASPVTLRFEFRHAARFPPGASYPEISREVAELLRRDVLCGLDVDVVIDVTHSGTAVADVFEQAGVQPLRVNVTEADDRGTMLGGWRYSVGRRNLVSLLDAVTHQDQLHIAEALGEEAQALDAGLKGFRHEQDAGLARAALVALWRANESRPSRSSEPRQTRAIGSHPEKRRGPRWR